MLHQQNSLSKRNTYNEDQRTYSEDLESAEIAIGKGIGLVVTVATLRNEIQSYIANDLDEDSELKNEKYPEFSMI